MKIQKILMPAFLVLCMSAALLPRAARAENAATTASSYQQDVKSLQQQKKEMAVVQKDIAKLRRELKAVEKVPDPRILQGDAQFENFDHDCYSGCEPTSLGGQCSDRISSNTWG